MKDVRRGLPSGIRSQAPPVMVSMRCGDILWVLTRTPDGVLVAGVSEQPYPYAGAPSDRSS